MVNAFLDFIGAHNLCVKSDKVLVAVSGGIDSVVLVSLFIEAGFDLSIAHCNFQLRGDESDEDEEFVKQLAASHSIPFHTRRFDTKNHALMNAVSTQMAARDLRYEWFRHLLKDEGYDYIATAHHLNDSIETAIFNFTKGTGISGLRGILPISGILIRPLLFASKSQIVEYALATNLKWREDSSNKETKYSRNLIRHKIIPVLKEINPSLDSTFTQTQRRLISTEKLLMDQAERFRSERLSRNGNDIYIEKVDIYSQYEVVLEEVFKPFGFNFQQILEIKRVLDQGSGKVFLSNSHQLNIDRDYLIISPLAEDTGVKYMLEEDTCVDNGLVTIRYYGSEEQDILLKRRHEATLDYDKLKFPLKLRKWSQGDSFRPLGMKGKKKLSDFMIDEKIPLNLKNRVCVVESAGEIIWVVGYRVDERFKVGPDTKRTFNMVMARHD